MSFMVSLFLNAPYQRLHFVVYSAHLQRLKAGINNLVKPTPCKWPLHLFEYVGRIEASFIITFINFNLYWPL